MATPAPFVAPFYLSDAGAPLAAGLLYTYEAGTNTPKTTYQDSAAAIANTNPIVLDAAGRASIFLGEGGYKFVLMSAQGETIWTRDNLNNAGLVGSFQVVDSIPTLKSLPGGVASYVQVMGHTTPGDGGDGVFRWASSSAVADDGGITIRPNSAPALGRWIRVFTGPVSVRWYGAFGTGAGDESAAILAAAAYVQALPSGGVLWFPPCSVSYGSLSALTFGSRVRVKIDKGAYVGGSITLKVNGSLEAGPYPTWINGTTVDLSDATVEKIFPQWWGAVGDGSTDDTTAFQAALDCLESMSNGVMEVPYTSDYYSLGSLTIGKSGITIRGGGRLATAPTLKYRETTGDFLTLDGGYSLFEGLAIHGNGTSGHVVYLQNAFRTKMKFCQIINSDAAAGPFVGVGLRVGSSGGNAECTLDHVLIQKCQDLLYVNTNDGFLLDCQLIDASRYHIYAPSGGGGSFGGWEVHGLRAYNNTVLGTFNSFTRMIYAENAAYIKIFDSELEISGATSPAFYFKFGAQVGNLLSNCTLYSQTNGVTFFEFASISGDAISYFKVSDTILHVANAVPAGNVGFIVSGAYGEDTRVILDNVTWDSTINTPIDTTALHFKVIVSNYTDGIVRKVAQQRTNPTENLFGVVSDVKLTDNASGFGYTLAALRGLATVQADASSALNTRATQGVVTLAGAFAVTGNHKAGYFQISDSRSAGAATDETAAEIRLDKSGAGTVTSALGAKVEMDIAGTGGATAVRLHHALLSFGSSSGAVTTLENFAALAPTRAGGTHAITTAYGFRSLAQKQSFVTTGYGFRQEGSSDLNQFDGSLGIGQAVQSGTKLAVGADAAFQVDYRLHETSATGVNLRFWKSRGTEASPTIISDGDTVARIDTLGYHGSSYFGMGQIMCKVDGTFSSGQRPPSRWEFYTSVGNGAQTLALTIDSAQRATFAATVIAPAGTTSVPPLRIPHGSAPSSPTNGDIWTTTAGLFVRINGATVGPLT